LRKIETVNSRGVILSFRPDHPRAHNGIVKRMKGEKGWRLLTTDIGDRYEACFTLDNKYIILTHKELTAAIVLAAKAALEGERRITRQSQ
jgi:hypothetical protein